MAEEPRKQLKVGDRVRRSRAPGSQGIVKDVRSEVLQSSLERGREPALIVSVLWDNGTYSNFTPDALEVV